MSTILIIGAGSNIGDATADKFAEDGYKVALASRTNKAQSKHKHFAFDASQPETVQDLFKAVCESVGTPSVVLYNAAAAHVTKPETPFSSSVQTVCSDMNVNAVSPWAAAHEAIKCFDNLGSQLESSGGTFIFTGNLLNVSVGPGFLTFGMGKSAAAHLIKHLALVAYPDKPYKFYWGDQRLADGAPMLTGLSGEAHADLYLELAKDPKQRPWEQTFVKDKGYVKFDSQDVWRPGS